MSIDFKLLGRRIKEQRILKGTTQEHFAEYMDVSVGYISQLERGITKISLERLAVIAEYLNCDLTLLLTGINSQTPEYMNKEFSKLYNELSSSEKRILAILVRDYLDNR